jgi:predicted nuclease of restriction endonuclease-like (RecB) superfamily
VIPAEYGLFLEELKERIRTTQLRAAVAVNTELVVLYWNIGPRILAAQQAEGWGAKVVDRLSVHLRREFPEMKGLSPTNLRYMRSFAEAWTNEQIFQQAVGKLPWGHNVVLIENSSAATSLRKSKLMIPNFMAPVRLVFTNR